MGRDWIHVVGVVPSTVHQKLVLWNAQDEIEIVEADDSPCYLQQMHVDFKVYDPNVKPISAQEGVIDKEALNACLIEQFGVRLLDQADETRPNDNDESSILFEAIVGLYDRPSVEP